MRGSTFDVKVVAAALHTPTCSAGGQAVRGGLQFNTASFDIEARDAYGNQVTAKNVNFVVSLTDRDSNKIQTQVRPCTLECPFVWETRVRSGY